MNDLDYTFLGCKEHCHFKLFSMSIVSQFEMIRVTLDMFFSIRRIIGLQIVISLRNPTSCSLFSKFGAYFHLSCVHKI